MKHVLLTTVVLALVLSALPHAQGTPDFSGTWRMDPLRSESANQGTPIGPVTVTISQTANELKMETSREKSKTTAVYKLDGSRSQIEGGNATARWEGTTLVIDAVLYVQGAGVTTKESWKLGAGGNELLVDRLLAVQHGYSLESNYGKGNDVFVKVKP